MRYWCLHALTKILVFLFSVVMHQELLSEVIVVVIVFCCPSDLPSTAGFLRREYVIFVLNIDLRTRVSLRNDTWEVRWRS